MFNMNNFFIVLILGTHVLAFPQMDESDITTQANLYNGDYDSNQVQDNRDTQDITQPLGPMSNNVEDQAGPSSNGFVRPANVMPGDLARPLDPVTNELNRPVDAAAGDLSRPNGPRSPGQQTRRDRNRISERTSRQKFSRIEEQELTPRNYQFQYNVDQEDYKNYYGHKEARQDGRVEGTYYNWLPNGRLMRVDYYVDGNSGYRPTITYLDDYQPQWGTRYFQD